MSWEAVEHTGDLALRLRAPDLCGLVETGVEALRALLFEGRPAPGEVGESGRVCVSGVDREDVLVRALSEALYLMQERALYPIELRVEPAGGEEGVEIEMTGVRADGRRLRLGREIKAVTYHAVEIRERAGRLETLVVLDV